MFNQYSSHPPGRIHPPYSGPSARRPAPHIQRQTSQSLLSSAQPRKPSTYNNALRQRPYNRPTDSTALHSHRLPYSAWRPTSRYPRASSPAAPVLSRFSNAIKSKISRTKSRIPSLTRSRTKKNRELSQFATTGETSRRGLYWKKTKNRVKNGWDRTVQGRGRNKQKTFNARHHYFNSNDNKTHSPERKRQRYDTWTSLTPEQQTWLLRNYDKGIDDESDVETAADLMTCTLFTGIQEGSNWRDDEKGEVWEELRGMTSKSAKRFRSILGELNIFDECLKGVPAGYSGIGSLETQGEPAILND